MQYIWFVWDKTTAVQNESEVFFPDNLAKIGAEDWLLVS